MAKEKKDWDATYKDLEQKWAKDSSVLDDVKKMKNINQQLDKNMDSFEKFSKKTKEKDSKWTEIKAKDSYMKVVSGVVGAKAIQDVEIHNKVGKMDVGTNVKDPVKTCDLVDAKVTDKKSKK